MFTSMKTLSHIYVFDYEFEKIDKTAISRYIIMINYEDHSKLLQILLEAVYLIVHFKCCKTVHYKKHMVDGIYYNLLIAMITH